MHLLNHPVTGRTQHIYDRGSLLVWSLGRGSEAKAPTGADEVQDGGANHPHVAAVPGDIALQREMPAGAAAQPVRRDAVRKPLRR